MGLNAFKTESKSKSKSSKSKSSKSNNDEDTLTISYKYRAYPTDEQTQIINEQFNIHKNIFNKALETLNSSDSWISKYDMYNKLPEWKKCEHQNFKEVNSKAAQQTVGRIYRAVKGLTSKKKKGHKVGKVRFKNSMNSIEYNQSGFKLKEDGIYLNKIGCIPIKFHRPVPSEAEIKGVVLKQYSSKKWKVVLQLEIPQPEQEEITEHSDVVGIDLNVSNFLTDSEGVRIGKLDILEDKLERVKREQKKLSRKEKGSNNWKKQRQILAVAHEKLRNARRDFLHKLSRWYVDNYDVIAVEKLEAKKLGESDSAKLNKHIRNHSWREFTSMLQYKASQAGKRVVEVNPEYTSQDCSNCRNRVEKSLSERTHSCPSCDIEIDRDYNSAVEILNRCLSNLGQGLSKVTPLETFTSGELLSSSPSEVVEQGSPSL